MNIEILTLFPEMFAPVTEMSMLGRAAKKGLLEIRARDIRPYTQDKHNRTDDYPFGGGGGMVQMADPVFRALEDIGTGGKRLLYMSPRGRIMDRELLEELAEEENIVILCGHYEGVDQRILDHFQMEEVSIGDYILTGGELPAMVLIDAVARLVPGVLGNAGSAMDESIYSGLLEHPQYTQPRSYRGMDVPEVLTGGDHRKIHLWRLQKSMELTARRRPQMLIDYAQRRESLARDEQKILDSTLQAYGLCSKMK